MALGGKYNRNLKVDGVKQPGWIFQKKCKAELEAFIASVAGVSSPTGAGKTEGCSASDGGGSSTTSPSAVKRPLSEDHTSAPPAKRVAGEE
jgi:hypothetical protein